VQWCKTGHGRQKQHNKNNKKRKSNLGGGPTSSERHFRVSTRGPFVPYASIYINASGRERTRLVSSTEQVDERKTPARDGRGWDTSNVATAPADRLRASYPTCTTRPTLASHLERTTNHRTSYVRRTTGSLRRSAAVVARRWCFEDAPVVLALLGVFANDGIDDGRRRPDDWSLPGRSLAPTPAFSTGCLPLNESVAHSAREPSSQR
jgi:hypothetical protein